LWEKGTFKKNLKFISPSSAVEPAGLTSG
jgi:hypothetical protein